MFILIYTVYRNLYVNENIRIFIKKLFLLLPLFFWKNYISHNIEQEKKRFLFNFLLILIHYFSLFFYTYNYL